MNEIVDKYKKGSKRTILIVYIIISIVSLAFIAGGTIMLIYSQDTVIIVLSVIMFIIALTNVTLYSRFYFKARRRIDLMDNNECIRRYKRIHGEQ